MAKRKSHALPCLAMVTGIWDDDTHLDRKGRTWYVDVDEVSGIVYTRPQGTLPVLRDMIASGELP